MIFMIVKEWLGSGIGGITVGMGVISTVLPREWGRIFCSTWNFRTNVVAIDSETYMWPTRRPSMIRQVKQT